MQSLDIIGRVAARRIADTLQAPGTRALFGIMGLRPDITSAMARHIAAISHIGPIEVFVHPLLRAGDLGAASVSSRTATWHRNHPTPGVRATIFSVPAAHIRSVEQSIGHVTRIDEAWLVERPYDWSEIALAHSLEETREGFGHVIAGLLASDLMVTPALLAEFCARVAQTMLAGAMLDNAVRDALPALRLPRSAGDAKTKISADAPAARQFFQQLRADAQPFLFRRNKEGETLAAGELLRKLGELKEAGTLGELHADRIAALCDDRNVRDGLWSQAQAAAAEIPWDEMSAVFAQARKTEKPTFGQDTRRLFDQEFRATLTDAEKEFLDGLKTDVATPGPKIDDFFESHRERLKRNPALYRRWEKLIFKKAIEVGDLYEGLLRLIDRVSAESDGDGDMRVYIWLRGSDQASFWANEKLKRQLVYLRDRYRGLDQLLAPEIILDFGLCWERDWEKEAADGPSGTNSIEFEAFLVPASEAGSARGGKVRDPLARAHMNWRPIANAIGYSLPTDLRFILADGASDAFLLTGSVTENRRSRGGASGIDLEDAASMIDTFGMTLGVLANSERESNLVCKRFLASLAELEADAIVTRDGAVAIRGAFAGFRARYSAAIAAMIAGDGLASADLIGQLEAFGDVFAALRSHAATEAGLRELFAPLLAIGSIEADSRRPGAIVTAWNPLRLAEIGAKARQFSAASKALTSSTATQRTGASEFLESRVRILANSYYGDIGRSGGHLLAETQRVLDCSLLEEAQGEGVRNIGEEGAKEAVEALRRITTEYLELRPHERTNFSIAMLGTESDDIPVLLANNLARFVDENPDVRCDLVITHDDQARLRDLYESQNRRIAAEIAAPASSDFSRGFLSRLRISLVGPDRLVAPDGGKGSDLILLQDVIARSAQVRWKEGEPVADPMDIAAHMPTDRSKRLPFQKRSVESGLFLTAPIQPAPVAAWTHALYDVLHRQVTAPAGPWLPLRWVEFVDTEVADVLARAHGLANWVVTFDRIADKRLIVQDGRRIIRYFSTPNSAHNVIVSAEVSSSDIGDRLGGDLAQLLPDMSAEDRGRLLTRIHASAARLSGAVVMRAAQWRNYAQEMLGLVLTERRLEGLFAAHGDHAAAWFFLDDNRRWLDLKGEMADIMGICFSADGEGPLVRVVIAEAKYCTASTLAQHRVKSLRQLEASYTEMDRRLLLAESNLDPAIWRNRIADMLLEHMDPFDTVGGLTQAAWLEALRQQTVRVEVSGHSMLFSFDLEGADGNKPMLPDEDLPPEERRPIAQWVHGRGDVVALLRSLGDDLPPPPLPLPPDWPHGGPPPAPERGPLPSGGGVAEQGADTEPLASAYPDMESNAVADIVPEPAEKHAAADSDGEAAPASATATPFAAGGEGWAPPIRAALLSMSHAEDQAIGELWLQEKVRDLQNALQAEGMDAPIIESRLTPNSALVYVGARTLTVGWLERRQTDLLTKHRIDIVRISPMPGHIAVAIRRPERAILHLADAWLRRSPSPGASPAESCAPLVGEKEDDGALLYLPLAGDFGGQERAAPHSLVSGNTGSGKGILATNLMLDLCALNAPEDIELHLIDPKRGVDYAWARRLPHLRGGIVADQDEAVALLERLVNQMEERYDLISERGYRNIDQYNRRVAAEERLPRVFIFFDEVANWMQDDDFKKTVDSLLNKIATKARAAGLHLFMVYQRADVQVMTMQLRTNLGNRLILRLPDEGSSKIALGEKGADRLLGKGHLIAKLDSDEKIYAQVPFIGDDEVEDLVDAIVAAWRQRGAPAS
ncbi:FtsK/SpoIIIE domain-containing protein [Sphingopyxis panaciterrulae]|uniref:S-DNA-T family DNA segregation ATPase FtsK/SpoIIIE n=2 Tax=Sphingopyxis TaxID=165697 RepID=A0A7W9ES45_9SPHN|nr:FtsK/SpoIIIE domain-containing protein [Sphingopyxis panaciterrulae]MBB5708373.1 S-DNA-T family DNA segregation ATPase FtsK/SpoIIIE [Sphingopyxis panaciterrulae]SBV32638.1 putative DNA segregation ATPase, FtsK/SpoIIIE family [uncultured Sphingopyxis sp.]